AATDRSPMACRHQNRASHPSWSASSIHLPPRLFGDDFDRAELSRRQPPVQIRELLTGERRELADHIVQLAAQGVGPRDLFLGRPAVVLIHIAVEPAEILAEPL